MFDFGGEFIFFDLVVLDVGDQVFEGFVFIDNNKDLKNKVKQIYIIIFWKVLILWISSLLFLDGE